MGDWTAYIHDRLTRIEKQVFGEDEATRIASTGPAYTAATEAVTTAGPVPPAGTAPAGPPLGLAVEPEPAAPVVDQSELIARLKAELDAAYAELDKHTPPGTPAEQPAGPAGSMAEAPVNKPDVVFPPTPTA